MRNNINHHFSLIQGDSLIKLSEIPDHSIDLIVTDPPYEMTKRGKSCRPNWMPDNMGANVFAGELPDFHTWLELSYQKLAPDSHIYIFTNTVSLQKILNAATSVGFKLHNVLVMIKDSGMPNRWYLKQTELVLFLRKGKAKPINDMTSRDWFHAVMPKARTGKLHITQKPIEPLEQFILNSSQPGDRVLDLFMGSGSTGVACLNTGRYFVGIEKDPGYFEIAKNRLFETLDQFKNEGN